jgi:hypothetical protein
MLCNSPINANTVGVKSHIWHFLNSVLFRSSTMHTYLHPCVWKVLTGVHPTIYNSKYDLQQQVAHETSSTNILHFKVTYYIQLQRYVPTYVPTFACGSNRRIGSSPFGSLHWVFGMYLLHYIHRCTPSWAQFSRSSRLVVRFRLQSLIFNAGQLAIESWIIESDVELKQNNL